MKKIFLVGVIFGLVIGCAGPPVRNPQFKESNLPERYRIEGVQTIKSLDASLPQTYEACVQTVLNFSGQKPTDTGAILKGAGAATLEIPRNASPPVRLSLTIVHGYLPE